MAQPGTDQELSGDAEKELKAAASPGRPAGRARNAIARNATPGPVAKGGLVLQPTDERRRSGSHYTPRSFTQPIVRKTLEPILKRLCSSRREEAQTSVTHHASRITEADSALRTPHSAIPPTPAQILYLKICDLAVGSAAFLVETCRQLGDALVKAWRHHGGRPHSPGR